RGVDREGNGAGVERAEEDRRPVEPVEEAHQDPLFGPHLQLLEELRELLGAGNELPVGPGPAPVDIGDFVGAAGIALKDAAGEVIVARDRVRSQCRQQSRYSKGGSLPGPSKTL